jgi:hypothetical protein
LSAGWSSARRRRLVPLLAVSLLTIAACGGGTTSGTGGQAAAQQAAAGDPLNLRGVCPATVVIQTSWFPEAEHGAVYQLLGTGYTLDAKLKRVTGPLVSAGVDTGVKVELRAGGPAIGSQQTSARMYADRSIALGMLNSDELIQQSATTPVLGVVGPLDLDPQVLAWDPQTHPDFNTISDIGQTSTRVLYFEGSPFMEYLLGAGILRRSQVDPSYDGTPGRFVADRGQDVVQAYATSEPYSWQHETPRWGKELKYALISDSGYPDYANTLAVRVGDRNAMDGCLRKLVPIIQRAQVQFTKDPGAAIEAILAANKAFNGFPYSHALADYSVRTMLDQGIIANGANHTLGDFDPSRITRLLGILEPIFAGQKKPVKDNLTVDDLVTNTYIDPSVSLPASK